MASTSLLLSSTLPSSAPRSLPTPRLFASSPASVAFPPQRRVRAVVLCEVAVELGGSRSSESKVEAGTRIRVLGPLKVFHVPKHLGLDIGGLEGEVKDVITTFKGKPVSATFPFKVQLMTPGDDGRKFFAHLKDDEFEVVE